MFVLMVFAFLSGIVTILSPCILPVLPVVLSGSVGGGKARPLGVVAGFVASFTVLTLALSAFVSLLGIPPDALRFFAVIVLILFGLVMIVPGLKDRFQLLLSRLAGGAASKKPRTVRTGFWGGLPVGVSLGIVWTPCVGPIMASVIGLSMSSRIDGGAVLITLSYTLGTALPMLLVMTGGRALLQKVPKLMNNTAVVQKVFGVLMIMVGVGIGFGWERKLQTAILDVFPSYGTGLTALEENTVVADALAARRGDEAGNWALPVKGNGDLQDLGEAPEIIADGQWFNTDAPLDMKSLRGKVVLIDFWTYSCINCIRTLPHLRSWYEKYKDMGLVIIGMHTPEFAFEKNPKNVAAAIKDLKVSWPVVQDNNYLQWQAYNNRYWPAHYFIDAKGHIRHTVFGEGEYEKSEAVIRELLKEAGSAAAESAAQAGSSPADETVHTETPEVYLGYGRAAGFTGKPAIVRDSLTEYRPAPALGNGGWTLEGKWTAREEFIVSDSTGSLEIGFNAAKVFLVIVPEEAGGSIRMSIDGSAPADTPDVRGGLVKPGTSRLYQLAALDNPGAHVLRLDVKGKLRLFAFTFG